MPKIKRKWIVTIDAELGSPFQEMVFSEAVRLMMLSLEAHYNYSHKKNKIVIDIKDKTAR